MRNINSKDSQTQSKREKQKGPPGGLTIFLARFVLLWERAWPIGIVSLAPLFVFLIASVCGLWRIAPVFLHWGAIGITIGACVGAWIWACRQILSPSSIGLSDWPTRADALRRLESDGQISHQAIQAIEDSPFDQSESPLWRAHKAAMERKASQAALTGPKPNVDRLDPWGLRFGAVTLIGLAAVLGGSETPSRLTEAFSPTTPALRQAGVADIWVEPPAYTGQPATYLLGPDQKLAGVREQLSVPEGSKLIIRLHGTNSSARIKTEYRTTDGDLQSVEQSDTDKAQQIIHLSKSGVLRAFAGSIEGNWPIAIKQDRPPTAQLAMAPQVGETGAINFNVKTEDDYGIVSARLALRLTADQKRPLDAPPFAEDAVKDVREIAIEGLAGPSGTRNFAVNLLSDPWAGLNIQGEIIVSDGAQQIGKSTTFEIMLPAPQFTNPLARTVVEQRQTLAVAPDYWRRAQSAFNGVTLGPDRFFGDPSQYLLLRTALWRVTGDGVKARDEKLSIGDFSETVSELWPLALQLENKLMSDARAALEAAQQALRDALERGASERELNQLTENLREAMNRYLQALAESPPQQSPNDSAPQETLEMSDLNEMLDSVRDLGANGAEEAAKQALSELENILNNLQAPNAGQRNAQGQTGQQGGQSGAPGQNGGQGGAAGSAADLIGRQRELADETYQQSLNNGSNSTPGGFGGERLGAPESRFPTPPGENPSEQGASGAADGTNDLTDQQQSITDDLNDLLDSIPRIPGPDGETTRDGARRLSQALEDMEAAEQMLGADALDAARGAMESAVENLRAGAEALAEAAQQATGEGERGQQAESLLDPAGREINGSDAAGAAIGDDVAVPGERDAQRAREILQELRRRLSTGDRDEEEIEYLERLLERF